jgi:hypothetical protein
MKYVFAFIFVVVALGSLFVGAVWPGIVSLMLSYCCIRGTP